ncbi:DUF1932 domain-containing protein [Paracoccus sp. TK19116]|uniref:DUF1932 domain-containing protein n=1 Tax=Paracoccus albicereus TaxID=2922394 RepID=A0ABT1MPW9_9RHOB|nr:DUF1932 domain-containing protein [Paracoccus albicereus]MCQ0970350.1 DUF1932 domain-containing protein [Paracoccus albicereus]
MTNASITFIGCGEAAGAFIEGWGSGAGIRAFDRKTEDAATATAKRADYDRLGVTGAADRAEALKDATAVFCTVTADQALTAARECAPLLPKGALWFDMNSCAPESKREASRVIEAAGGRYVDVAVMAPVYPKRHQVPLLIAGPHAEAGKDVLVSLNMAPRIAGENVGDASTIKMVRSVMIKGMEALTAECALAAVRAGVDEAVIGSLVQSFPGIDWPEQVAYNLERMTVHGQRRAAELEEVAVTLDDLGLPSDMARAIVQWQRRLGRTTPDQPVPDMEQGYRGMAQELLEGSDAWRK